MSDKMKIIINEKPVRSPVLGNSPLSCVTEVTQPRKPEPYCGRSFPWELIFGRKESLTLDFFHEAPQCPELLPCNPFMQVYLPVCL